METFKTFIKAAYPIRVGSFRFSLLRTFIQIVYYIWRQVLILSNGGIISLSCQWVFSKNTCTCWCWDGNKVNWWVHDRTSSKYLYLRSQRSSMLNLIWLLTCVLHTLLALVVFQPGCPLWLHCNWLSRSTPCLPEVCQSSLVYMKI